MKHMFGCDIVKGDQMTGADRILIALVLSLSVLLAVAFLVTGLRADRAVAVIEQDGKEIMRLFLWQERTVRIDWDGGYNVVTVSEGGVRVSEADCPDQICVRQGVISMGQETIVCLPHRLMIRLEKAEEGVDAMTKGEQFEKDGGFEYAYRICPDAFLCGGINSCDAGNSRH